MQNPETQNDERRMQNEEREARALVFVLRFAF
jgi:hypothetical protein